jgi:rhamnosyltransferase subunit B
MHFIISPMGSAGDVHPMMGLSCALRDRGHEITFVGNSYFRDRIEALSLTYVELGTADEFREMMSNPLIWHPVRSLGHLMRTLLTDIMRPQYDIIADHHLPGKSVVIASCLGLGARVARDKIGLPLITLNLQPAVMWSFANPPRVPLVVGPRWLKNLQYRIGERFLVDPIVCPQLNQFRSELDLPAVRHIPRWWHSPDGVACLFPDWFAMPQVDWPQPVLQTSFPLWDFGQQEPLSSEVETFLDSGDPPIAFTPGSANIFGQSFFEQAVKTCGELGRRGVLLSHFAEHIPANLPPSVAYFPYVPFTRLLPRCAAVVHHGGVGTTAQGLKAGIPQLIVALAHDQYDNGERIQRAGVGDWLSARRFRADRATKILGRILECPQVADACRRMADQLTGRDGLAEMAVAIERHVGQ